ncbi:MAG: Spy/CpxP family protein refolding chaperone [Burkholderiaceae bacterium]
MNGKFQQQRGLRQFPRKTAIALAGGALALSALVQVPAWADNHGMARGAGAEQGERGGAGKGDSDRWSGKHGEHGKRAMRGERGGRDHDGMGMLRGLNLTDEQKSKLEELRLAQGIAMQKNHETMQAARLGMREMVESGTFDDAKAKAYAEQIGAAAAAMSLQRAITAHGLLAVLTDEQKAELKKRRDERAERGHGMRGEGRHGKGPHGEERGRGKGAMKGEGPRQGNGGQGTGGQGMAGQGKGGQGTGGQGMGGQGKGQMQGQGSGPKSNSDSDSGKS